MRTRSQQFLLERLLYRIIELSLRIPLMLISLLMTIIMMLGAAQTAMLYGFQQKTDLPHTPLLDQINNLLKQIEGNYFSKETL